MSDHEKKRLPRGVELEKRRYIGFARTPVVDRERVFPSNVTPPRPQQRDEYGTWPGTRPWREGRQS